VDLNPSLRFKGSLVLGAVGFVHLGEVSTAGGHSSKVSWCFLVVKIRDRE
jgi:hypothetical protein